MLANPHVCTEGCREDRTLERQIHFEPSEGRIRIRFVLLGPEGATQFLWNVWTKGRMEYPFEYVYAPEGWDVGFHALAPRDWQEESDARDCDIVPGGRCYYDGSSLQGEELGKRFMAEGEEVVWAELEERYRDWLLGESYDAITKSAQNEVSSSDA